MSELENTKARAQSMTGEAHSLMDSVRVWVTYLYAQIQTCQSQEQANYLLAQAQGLRDGLAALLEKP